MGSVRFTAEGQVLKRTGGLGFAGSTVPYTITGWAKRLADRNTYSTMTYVGDGTTSDGHIVSTAPNGTTLMSEDITENGRVTGPTMTTEVWYFFASVVTSSSHTLYWRTDAASSLSSGSGAVNTSRQDNLTQLWVGDNPWPSEWFNGSVTSVKLWDAALTGAEILDESNSRSAVRTSGSQGVWALTGASDLADTSGNARTLVAGGGAVTDENEPASLTVGAAVPVVDAGVDASHLVSTQFNRTASENDGGAAITDRSWTIESGPTGVGSEIGTAAALAWTPTVVGEYILQYAATNTAGTGTDTVTVTVYAAATPLPAPPTVDRVALVEASAVTVAVTVDLLDEADRPVGTIPVDGCIVRHDGNADIHRSVELVTTAQLEWGVARVQPWVTVIGGGESDTVSLGVFLLTAPVQDTADPPTWTVNGFDKLYLLDQRLSAPVSYPAGQPILFIVRSLLAQHGFASDRIDNARAADVLSEARSWALEFDGTYLDVVNDLLTMVGYEQLWMTAGGLPTSSPRVSADAKTVVWRYDAQSPTTLVRDDGRGVVADFTDAPNQWQFWRADVDRDDPPVIGDGLYVVNNESQGPSSQAARGGLIVRSSNDGPIEAASQIDLETNGDAIVAAEIEGVTTYRWQSDVNPYHGHRDTLEIIDRQQGVASRFTHVSWELDVVGLSMTHEAHMIAGGVIDAG